MMDFTEIQRQYGKPLINVMFANGLYGQKPLERFDIVESKKTALEQIAELPLLHDRITLTRLHRYTRLKEHASLQEICQQELYTEWPHGPALPPPTMDDPFSLQAHLPGLASREERVIAELRMGLYDVLASIELDDVHPSECDAVIAKYRDLSSFQSSIDAWTADYHENARPHLAALSAYTDGMKRAHAFFELDQEFVGLDFLKNRIWGMQRARQFESNFAYASGAESSGSMHMAFVAERGMGKSTIAEKLGDAMERLGLLQHARVVKLSLATVAETTLGGVESAVRKAFEEAQGGILLFDEVDTVAGHLARGQKRSAISQAINELAEKQREDTCLIVATYPSHIDAFLDSDEGLRSRFGDRIIHFPDYTTAQLVQMYDLRMGKMGFRLENDAARSQVWEYLSKLRQNEHKFFASGRTVRELAQATQAVLSARLERNGELLSERYNSLVTIRDEHMTITAADIRTVVNKFQMQYKPEKLDVFTEENPFKAGGENQMTAEAAQVVTLHDFHRK